MIKAIQESIRKALGLPGIEECGSSFGRWMERTLKYGGLAVFLILLVWWLLYLFFINPLLDGGNALETVLALGLFLMGVILVSYDMTALACFFQSPQKSEYYLATGVTRKDIVNDKGVLGEFYAYVLSRKLKIPHRTLYNVCIPMPNGSYQEIDAIIITNRWIHVLECKNRAGYFTGNFNSEIWVQHLGREEHRVKNIYKQNASHIAALEYFLKSRQVLPDMGVFCANSMLTGGEMRLDMGDINEMPADFGFGNYNLLKKSMEDMEKNQSAVRDDDFMEKVYRALLPYALFPKAKRESMLMERESRAKNKEFVRGNYKYYEFPNGIPGLTDDDTLLRQDKVFTQIKVDENERNPLWITIPYLRYEERR